MNRIEMPLNVCSLKQQIINHLTNVDFNKFLEENAGAKTYYDNLNEEQQWQYEEDFWYFIGLISEVSQPLVKIEFPTHKK